MLMMSFSWNLNNASTLVDRLQALRFFRKSAWPEMIRYTVPNTQQMVITIIQPITPTTISRRIHIIIWQDPHWYQSPKGELLLFPHVQLTGPLRRNSPKESSYPSWQPNPRAHVPRGGEQACSFVPCVEHLLMSYGFPPFYTHTWSAYGWSLSVPAVIGWGRESFQEIIKNHKTMAQVKCNAIGCCSIGLCDLAAGVLLR